MSLAEDLNEVEKELEKIDKHLEEEQEEKEGLANL